MNSPLPVASVAVRITFGVVIVVSALLLLNRATRPVSRHGDVTHLS